MPSAQPHATTSASELHATQSASLTIDDINNLRTLVGWARTELSPYWNEAKHELLEKLGAMRAELIRD